MTDYKIGQKLRGECICCDEEEIWEVESITDEEYTDGVFKTYHLKAIKHCIGDEIRTSIKAIPELLNEFSPLPEER